MNFKVGDKVRVKTSEEIYDTYGHSSNIPFGINDDMKDFFGQTMMISSITKLLIRRGSSEVLYSIKLAGDGYGWSWHQGMMISIDMTDKVHNEIKRLLT